MTDDDQQSCGHHYGSFMLAGDNSYSLGVGENIFKTATSCGQCVQITNSLTKKTTFGMITDYCPPNLCTMGQLEVSKKIAGLLGFAIEAGTGRYMQPAPSALSLVEVSCTYANISVPGGGFTYPDGKLRYFFGPGSKDTSFELFVLGGAHPIKSLALTTVDGPATVLRETNKFKLYGFNLVDLVGSQRQRYAPMTFTIEFTDGTVKQDTINLTSILNPAVGSGSAFFKNGAILTDKDLSKSGDKVNPPVYTWPDFVVGN